MGSLSSIECGGKEGRLLCPCCAGSGVLVQSSGSRVCEGPAAARTDPYRLSGLSNFCYCPALWITGHGSGLGAESSTAPTPEFQWGKGTSAAWAVVEGAFGFL